jgi:hypothetical protein
MMLQEMRVRLAVTAANANGPVEPPDTVNIVASLMTHSVPMVVVAARARFGPVSGSQRMSRPVVAKVPAAVAMARAISGRTGMAASSATRPVRQGCGCSRSSHQIPTKGPVAMYQVMVRRAWTVASLPANASATAWGAPNWLIAAAAAWGVSSWRRCGLRWRGGGRRVIRRESRRGGGADRAVVKPGRPSTRRAADRRPRRCR